MQVQHKDATIENTGDEFPGSFRVILSTSAKDRDGDELHPQEWKTPLPEHITFDADHGMSVATTVGSGRPFLNEKDADGVLPVPQAPEGALVVDGGYASLPRAQEVRTLVNEGHIRTTSVAFMNEKSTEKDGKTQNVRELLNGAFVAIPSNREALVLSSKSATGKSGARNSKTDQERLQAAHDAIVQAGAQCKPAGKSLDPHDQAGATQTGDPEPPADDDTADEDLADAVTEFLAAIGDGEGLPDEALTALEELRKASQADTDEDDPAEPGEDGSKALAADAERLFKTISDAASAGCE